MNGIWLRTGLVGCVALLAGCVNPQRTRLPSLAYGDPRAERQSYNLYDPLAEPEEGPFVERPRGFERPRTEPQRARDRFDAVRSQYESPRPSAAAYPNAVQP